MHCLIMEKIEGEDLETWLNKRQRPINQKVALKWLKELTEILQVVHQEQFFHRDIKPSNIMLKPDVKLALIDFGTVKEATHTYMAKAKKGKRATVAVYSQDYTPTEQQNGYPVPQSDFFALGRTFVHLLTKQPPLQFYDPHTDKLNWQDSAPNIDPVLKNFIDQLIQRLSKDRPANTTVILQEIAWLWQYFM
ncbi:MAG: serine/threonine protein kinase [Crocosphaera sp.]